MKQKLIEGLPVAGIIAFSGCSVKALYHWMHGWSKNPHWWYLVAALLVEGATAWLVWSMVDTIRTLTRSRLSKQDKRFYRIILLLFVSLSVPSLTASVVANFVEFRGNPLLAVLFPVLTVASAVGTGLPDVVKRYEQKKEEDKKPKPVRQSRTETVKEGTTVGQPETIVQPSEDSVRPKVPELDTKSDRLTWLAGQRDNLPDIADMVTTWGRSERTVRRYLSEVQDKEVA